MSNIIHMETEIVRDFSKSSFLKVAAYWEDIENLNNKVQNIPWEGANSAIYQSHFRILSKNLEKSIENICELLLKVTREVDGWIAVDNRNAGEYEKIKSKSPSILEIINPIPSMKADISRLEFNIWWAKLSYEERLDFIIKEHEKIARSLGLEPVPIIIEEVPGKGDAFYSHFSNTITIDPNSLDEWGGSKIISLIAHETRHQYQHDCVVYYEQTGNAPEGVSVEQVQSWKINFEDYIDLDDDPKGYRNQPVENDAYSFGYNYLDEYFEPNSNSTSGGGGGGW